MGVEYPAEAVPSDEDIKQDLLEGLGWLARLYGASDELFDDAWEQLRSHLTEVREWGIPCRAKALSTGRASVTQPLTTHD